MSPQLVHPGRLGRPRRGGGGESFSPTDNPGVIEVYNAWDTSKHTYVAARSITQIVCDSILGKATVSCAGHGFLNGDVAFLDGDLGAFPNLEGAQTIIATPSADIFEIAQGEYDGTEEYEAPLPTADWRDRKVSADMGMRGLYSFTQGTLANMPQWDAANKRMLFIQSRSYFMNVPDALRDAFTGAARSVVIASRATIASSVKGIIGGDGNANFARTVIRYNTAILQSFWGTGALDLSYSNASVNNGEMKFIVGEANASGRTLFVNDPVSSVANTSGDSTPAAQSVAMYVGRASSDYMDGSIEFVAFADALSDQTYREKTKQWLIDNYGVTFG